MASSALSGNDSALLLAIFKNADSSNLDYARISEDIGCKKEQMAGRMFTLRKKIKANTGPSGLSVNESDLLKAIFKVINATKLDYDKLSTEIGCKKSQMAGRMFALRKKLGVTVGQTSGASPAAAVTTRVANKAAVRAKKSNGDVAAGKGRGRGRKAKKVEPEMGEKESLAEDEKLETSDDSQRAQEADDEDDNHDAEIHPNKKQQQQGEVRGQEDAQDRDLYIQVEDEDYQEQINTRAQRYAEQEVRGFGNQDTQYFTQGFAQQLPQGYGQYYMPDAQNAQEDDDNDLYYDALSDDEV